LLRPEKRIFYGWWVALASSAIVFLGGGLTYYGMSAYFDSIVAEFGWKRAVISGAYSLRSLESGILTPVAGFLIDRAGPRIVFLIGVALSVSGLLWLGSINSIVAFYLAFALTSLGTSACGIATALSATAKWFNRKRGKALGLAAAGGGASGFLVTLVAWLIVTLGWRQTLFVSAAIIFVFCIPLSLLVRHRPEDYGYLPDGESESRPEIEPARAVTENMDSTARQALATRSFWLITLAMGFQSLGLSAVIVHEIPFLTSIGFSPQSAALVMTLTVVLSLVGRFGYGGLADTYDTRLLLAVSFLLSAGGLLILAFTQETWQIAFFLVTFGVSYAARVPLAGALQGEYFGRTSFGAIQGLLHSLTVVFGMAGPVLTGWLFDINGSYRLAFVAMAGFGLLSIPLILAVGRKWPKLLSPVLEA
jgi:MFS family permease